MIATQKKHAEIYQKIHNEVMNMPIEQAQEVLDFAEFMRNKSEMLYLKNPEKSTQDNPKSETSYFDASRTLSIDELVDMVGVETNQESTIEEMDKSIDKLFRNWECDS